VDGPDHRQLDPGQRDENLRPRVTAGEMIRGPVGSNAIRAAIER